ncbi:MAG: chromosome segregation protein [Chthoniobacteraceae bacterium]|nr:chromosome segregation protein [Chthoniobacteraceae bacterium]
MYLQSLELFGFKSFAPKTKLEFHRGVTAVVGPNGCGKSNVLDAMRWVLGEQSAKALRGGEMADVIFSGTDSRAAVGMAEVSMTFSECEEQLGLEWHEVTITRRVFRDGGSEYLLNKTTCRLRDIQQLFMDTGIGRSAYSIMEQGKIDMILSSRPEDRRAIFEEAAGITKYKSQKKEALRKLEATDANMVRLSDIIKEVRRQIGSLQRQAGKARRYQSLLSDLRLLETHSAKRQFDQLESQRALIEAEQTRLVDRQAECEEEIERQESEVSVQRAVLADLEGQLNAARQIVGDLRTRISNHENRIIFNQERAGEFEGLVERYGSEVAGAEEKLRIAETQLHDTDAELEQITTMLAGELRVLEAKQAATAALVQQRQEAERAINSLAGDASRLESKISALRGQTSMASQQRESAEGRLAMLSGDLSQIESSLARIIEQQSAAQTEIQQAQAELERATAALAGAEQQLKEHHGAMAGLDQELRTTQRLLSDKESRLEVLRQLNEGGEGFSEGTQAILRGLDNPAFFKPAIFGALAQFIEVAPEFVSAVEACLGSHLQTIVMKDTMIAESIIRTLTEKKMGKASMALRQLEQVFEHRENREMRLPAGALDWLINKVKAAPEIKRLIERLVNHTVLVPDIETAMRLFPQNGSMIVTLSGEVLTCNGILYGGATSEAQNSVLQRKNQIAVLENEANGIHAAFQQINSRRDALLSEIEETQQQLDDSREEKQNSAIHVSTLRGQLAALERELRETERKQQNLEGERASSEARVYEATLRLEGLEEEVNGFLEQFEALQSRRTEAQTGLEIVRAQENEVGSELNELRIKVATERQRHTSLHHQRQPMEARLTELGDLIAQRQRDIASYAERAESMLAEISEIEANLGRLRVEAEERESHGSALVAERTGIAVSVDEMNTALRHLRQQLNDAHNQRSRVEVKQSQLEMKLAALCEHIQKRYQIELRDFQNDHDALRSAIRDQIKRLQRGGAAGEEPAAGDAQNQEPEEVRAMESFELDWEKIDAIVREIDQRIDSMGPVNLDAIQEYDELEERNAFLEKQNNDLITSRAELLDVIAKINQTTKTLFADTFEKIRVNFSEMFVELFGGGKANLLLTNESDPLESGIDIIAKPPGKQLQSISLLSGGERTMTAVALLFSIYMVKPAPFCVLDEMDAPLDESNISRFIKILDRFVGQSQFIVISHHKRTIARADALYGVTMEEHGVSRLVGVKFSRRDESVAQDDVLGTSERVPSVAETFGKSGKLHSEKAG